MTHVALLDCNNFFVSCERLFRPDLRQTPVVVLSSNDGCVVARSQEVKDKEIPMGVPYFRIKDILETMGAVVFSSHFALYRDISRRVFELVAQEYKEMEQYSIDECFIRFDSEQPEVEMQALKERIERCVGIPVSIGVASSKTLAKYARTHAKRTSGVHVLSMEQFIQNAETCMLGEIWGVGRARAERFLRDGVRSVADLLALSPSVVAGRYGVEGVRLQTELSGVSVYPCVVTRAPQKSVMSTRSFARATTEAAVVKDALFYHLEQTCIASSAMGLVAGTVRVVIAPSRYGEHALLGASEEVILPQRTASIFVLQRLVTQLFSAVYIPGVSYKKAGIILGDLAEVSGATISLFGEDLQIETIASLMKTVVAINKKFGGSVVHIGRVPNRAGRWQESKAALSPAYTTNWKDIRVVQAAS